ncbi:hypothetical protein FACS189485_16390 [Spirochaetia bacterium]|nr:hypothetical protein FACS189485_16390 [Spirochaetia bacterium]
MNIGLIIFFSMVIILWAILKKKTQNEKTEENNVVEEFDPKNDTNEIEEIFYEEVRNGEKTYKLMNVINQFDLMFVKSLFQSEQIPYYIEGEHISQIRPGMQIGSFGNASVYILEKDYNDAINVIENYRKNKKENYKEKQSIRKPLEVIGGNWVVPEANDINGIEILYKK